MSLDKAIYQSLDGETRKKVDKIRKQLRKDEIKRYDEVWKESRRQDDVCAYYLGWSIFVLLILFGICLAIVHFIGDNIIIQSIGGAMTLSLFFSIFFWSLASCHY